MIPERVRGDALRRVFGRGGIDQQIICAVRRSYFANDAELTAGANLVDATGTGSG